MLGFAYTSPEVVHITLDRSRFKLFVATKDDLSIVETDGRKAVLLVPSIKALRNLDLKPFGAVVIFDTPQLLSRLPEVTIVDAKQHDGSVWNKQTLDISIINDAVDGKLSGAPAEVDLTVVDTVLADYKPPPKKRGRSRSGFSEALSSVLESMKDSSDKAELELASCRYVTGLAQVKDYNAAKKAALAAGAEKDSLDKLLRTMNGKTGQCLFSAYYHHCMSGKSIADAATEYKVEVDDLNYLAEIIPPSDKLSFLATPPK